MSGPARSPADAGHGWLPRHCGDPARTARRLRDRRAGTPPFPRDGLPRRLRGHAGRQSRPPRRQGVEAGHARRNRDARSVRVAGRAVAEATSSHGAGAYCGTSASQRETSNPTTDSALEGRMLPAMEHDRPTAASEIADAIDEIVWDVDRALRRLAKTGCSPTVLNGTGPRCSCVLDRVRHPDESTDLRVGRGRIGTAWIDAERSVADASGSPAPARRERGRSV